MNTDEIKTTGAETAEPKVPQEEKKKKRGGKRSKTSKLEARIGELEEELSESKDKYIRLYAEFDNYKKRTIKERLDLISTAGRDTIASLLPVLDDFERALTHIEEDKEAEELRKGVLLIYQKLLTALEQKGLKKMKSKGEKFDSEFHQALTEIPAPTEDLKGKVVDVVESGYFIGEKILRHARVVVGK